MTKSLERVVLRGERGDIGEEFVEVGKERRVNVADGRFAFELGVAESEETEGSGLGGYGRE